MKGSETGFQSTRTLLNVTLLVVSPVSFETNTEVKKKRNKFRLLTLLAVSGFTPSFRQLNDDNNPSLNLVLNIVLNEQTNEEGEVNGRTAGQKSEQVKKKLVATGLNNKCKLYWVEVFLLVRR